MHVVSWSSSVCKHAFSPFKASYNAARAACSPQLALVPVPEKAGADCHSVPVPSTRRLIPRPNRVNMAKVVQGKEKEGLRPRGFSIPSVEDIRQANKVSAGERPTLFKSAAASCPKDMKEKLQPPTVAVERTKDNPGSDIVSCPDCFSLSGKIV